jgi:hypothetical protein
MIRYRSCRPPDTELRTQLRDLANERKRFGYRRLFVLLRKGGEPSGINRIYRLYREEGLTARKRGVAAAGRIRVWASTDERWLELAVANEGDQIDPVVMKQLFQPFFRGNSRSSNQGLGLGLYIASEIARAHDGTIDVATSKDQTRFTLRIPRSWRSPGALRFALVKRLRTG